MMMQDTPITGFPENPEKKNRLEQLSIMIERHNFLVDQVSLLEQEFDEKNKRLEYFKEIVKKDIEEQKIILEENKKLFEIAERLKKEVGDSFKEVVKKPFFEKLNKRVNDLRFEDFVHREELNRKIL